MSGLPYINLIRQQRTHPDMHAALPIAEEIAHLLSSRHQTLAVAESSAGGLISATLLAVPGASAFFLGGAVVYTRDARNLLLEISAAQLENVRPSTEPYALLLAQAVRSRLGSTWSIGETGAAGPSGNRYGDPAGHACLAVVGPSERSLTVETGSTGRLANMEVFASTALDLLVQLLRSSGA